MDAPKPPPLFSPRAQRFRMALIMMVGLFSCMAMRLNLSMGMTCMVNTTAIVEHHRKTSNRVEVVDEQCLYAHQNATIKSHGYEGTLLWSASQQSVLFSATFYGSVATIGFSGYLADRFGPKRLLLGATIVESVLSLLSPLAASESYYWFFAVRVLIGLGDGFINPTLNSMASRWFPATEKAAAIAIYTSGQQAAAAFGSLISAGLCASPLGWPSIFYAFGGFGLMWCILWCVVASDYPADNKFISSAEILFLQQNAQTRASRPSHVPWRRLFSSPAVLAVYVAMFSYWFCGGILQAFLPTYFKEVLMLPIGLNGLYMMVPFCAQLLSKNTLGPFSDYLKRSGKLSHTVTVKIFQSIGSFGSALALVGMALFPSCRQPAIACVFLAMYGVCFSAGMSGYFTSMLSIAPPFSGTISSIAMFCGNLASICGPMFVGLVSSTGTSAKWPIVFGLIAFFNTVAGIVFLIWGSGREQEWVREREREERERELPKTSVPSYLPYTDPPQPETST